jgi:hypothetical protein
MSLIRLSAISPALIALFLSFNVSTQDNNSASGAAKTNQVEVKTDKFSGKSTVTLKPQVLLDTPKHKVQPIAIYYGYPSLVNGAKGDLDKAARTFDAYSILVIGDRLELPDHPDHSNVVHLLPKLHNTKVFGYVCIGSTQNLSMEDVRRRVFGWKQTGVHGVFLDEAGRDYGVSHDRREEIIDIAHREGLSVFVNAFQPADVFDQGTHLTKGDYYLLESFIVRNGVIDNTGLMNSRIRQALKFRERYNIGIIGVTTTTTSFSARLYRVACTAAKVAALDGFGWGEPWFSSQSNSLSNVPVCF